MFNHFSPGWNGWAEKIARETRYDSAVEPYDVDVIMTAMLDLGFTIEPPKEAP